MGIILVRAELLLRPRSADGWATRLVFPPSGSSNLGLRISTAKKNEHHAEVRGLLKNDFQPELKISRAAGAGDLTEGRRAERVPRASQRRRVEEVESLEPELKSNCLGQAKILHRREVEKTDTRFDHRVASHVPIRERLVPGEGRRVEIFFDLVYSGILSTPAGLAGSPIWSGRFSFPVFAGSPWTCSV